MVIGKLGTTELLVIFAIVLLIFGPKYLPRLGKSFGKTIKGFKDGLDNQEEEDMKIESKNTDDL
ncbi:MAG: twin-arginine translocase TatA/TatE family subunit [Lachnospiraceae bacterium]|nr:twin-arginine translocase TatA/TatE family subunit [Lachnospiraceae bacterium]